MPAKMKHPGVYVEEVPSGLRAVAGVTPSTAAFVDLFADGPITTDSEAHPVRVSSFAEFESVFGGLDARSEASYGLLQFFQNGGETAWVVRADDGSGDPPGSVQLTAAMKSGLDSIAPKSFNILCLPITATYPAPEASAAINTALAYCRKKRAFMIVDIPESVGTVADMLAWIPGFSNAANSIGAVYFPRLFVPDPLQEFQPRNVGPSGTMAGVYARTDARRGVWKAPAGVEAVLLGAEVALETTHDQNGQLTPLGVNCLRTFPMHGHLAWGARTLAGADQIGSEWKYVPVRRLTDTIELSLERALEWVVFEPNDEPLWSKIRLQVEGFLEQMFRQGAFAGSRPDVAFFVRCDHTTTTPTDIARGVVNIAVGFAPLKPAEFIILRIEQAAGRE